MRNRGIKGIYHLLLLGRNSLVFPNSLRMWLLLEAIENRCLRNTMCLTGRMEPARHWRVRSSWVNLHGIRVTLQRGQAQLHLCPLAYGPAAPKRCADGGGHGQLFGPKIKDSDDGKDSDAHCKWHPSAIACLLYWEPLGQLSALPASMNHRP